MSHEVLSESIKTKLPQIEPALLHSIWEVVERAECKQHAPIASGHVIKTQALAGGELQCIGENPPFLFVNEEHLSIEEGGTRRQKTSSPTNAIPRLPKANTAATSPLST